MLTLDRALSVAPMALGDRGLDGLFDAIGYIGALGPKPNKQHSCAVVDKDLPAGVVATTCFGFPGVSGAPLVTTGGQPVKVLGMLVANRKRTSYGLTVAHIRQLLDLR